jgi:hypothetical protein
MAGEPEGGGRVVVVVVGMAVDYKVFAISKSKAYSRPAVREPRLRPRAISPHSGRAHCVRLARRVTLPRRFFP